MKIAVLTFFESENYGTVLQAYALQKYLQKQGHTVELLHIKRMVNGQSSHYKVKKKPPTFLEKVQYKVVSILQKKNIQSKTEKFKNFRKEYLCVSKYYDSEEALKERLEDYELFISGGDQIWNPYHKVFSLHYMLDFLPEDKPRIAYGSSFGVAHIDDLSILSKMKEQLNKYTAIGVREQSGVEIVKGLSLPSSQVLDPVFLGKEEWSKFIGERPLKKKYCLVYALIEYPEEEKRKILAYAKKNDLEVVILPYNRQNCLNGFKKGFGLSPQEFLNYIAHAEQVITNSFHGVAFSILLEKQFTLLGCASEEGMAKRERLIDVMKQFEIENREIGTAEEIDYQKVNKIVRNRIADSETYIKEAIKKAGE